MLRAHAWQSFRVVLGSLSPGEDFFRGKRRDHASPGLSTTPPSFRGLLDGRLHCDGVRGLFWSGRADTCSPAPGIRGGARKLQLLGYSDPHG